MSLGPRPRLLFLATEDWFFASHFLHFAEAARDAGFEPVLAARLRDSRAAIEAAGIRTHPVETERGAVGIGALVSTAQAYRRAIRTERPALVHCIALKPLVLGGIVARLLRVPALVLAPTGLGLLWTSNALRARLGRIAVRAAVRMIDGPRVRFLCENPDDPRALGLDPADPAKVTIVAGAGVSATEFVALPDPGPGPLRVAVVARMVRTKGVEDAVEAVRLARAGGLDVELELWGEPDLSNPESLTEDQLRRWSAEPGIAWRGRAADVREVWRRNHAAMLLSHGGEGLPRSLVEAAACGRPVITTDVPGCREVVTDGQEGALVPPRDAGAAAVALGRFADPATRVAFGAAARVRFERDMTVSAVNGSVRRLYQAEGNAARRARAERPAPPVS